MKNATTPQESFNTIPATDGFFLLSISEDTEGKPVADRDMIIGWVVRVSVETSGRYVNDPLICSYLIPVTPWGVEDSDKSHTILSPDGRVTETDSSRWNSEAEWLEEQTARTGSSRG